MDWNWFFSSISQSAAAIVGLFGAFILSKTLNNQAAFQEKSNRVKRLLSDADKLKLNIDHHYFAWYNKHTNNSALEKIRQLLEEDPDGTLDMPTARLYNKLDFSPFTPKQNVMRWIENILSGERVAIAKRAEERRKRLQARSEFNNTMKGFGLGGLGSTMNLGSIEAVEHVGLHLPLTTAGLDREIREERESIERSLIEAKYHCALVADHLASLEGNPESSPYISIAALLATLLFIVGVIYPLSFMPLPVNAVLDISFTHFFPVLFSWKGAFLTVITIVFSTIPAMFFVLNRHLKYPEGDLNKLKALTSVREYSPYFQIMDDNLSEGESAVDDSRSNS